MYFTACDIMYSDLSYTLPRNFAIYVCSTIQLSLLESKRLKRQSACVNEFITPS